MPTTQEAEQQENDEVESLEREGISLRWTSHRLHGANIGLRQRHDETMDTLESRSDGEARAVMLRLAREFREMNGELAAHLSRMSMLNLGVVEMMRKSRDGRAALMMRSAAEILVKGLANAEEEVYALKASLKEVEGQRDGFKALLAKTNSELEVSHAYDQISRAVGEDSAPAAASSTPPTTKAAAAPEGVVAGQTPGKGRAPGHQEQQTSSGGGGGGSGGSGGGSGVSIAAADGRNQSGSSSGTDRGSGKGDPRGEARKRPRGASRAGAAAAVPAAASAAAVASAGAKRKGGYAVGVGEGAIPTGSGGLEETNRHKKQRKGGGREEGLGSPGRKGNGVDLTLSQDNPDRWVEPWKDGDEGGVAGGRDGDVGGGDGDAGSEGGLQGVYDSDDAPSMFF